MAYPRGDWYWLPCPGRIDYAAARFHRPCNAAAAIRESMAVDPYLEAPAGFFAIDVRHELLEIMVAFTAQSLGNEYRFPIGRPDEAHPKPGPPDLSLDHVD